MNAIGFTTKYFTLWDVYEQPIYFCDSYGKNWQTGINTHHIYVKNISFSREKTENLFPGVIIDTDLCGTRSWSEAKKYEDTPVELYFFGKHYGERVEDVVKSDFSYVLWSAENVTNSKQCKYINSLPEVVEYKATKALEMEASKNAIPRMVEGMTVELEFRYNPNYSVAEDGLSWFGLPDADYELIRNKNYAWANIPGTDWRTVRVNVIFNDVKHVGGMYPYTMAIINGKAQKIKGKTLPVKVSRVWIQETPDRIEQTILVN